MPVVTTRHFYPIPYSRKGQVTDVLRIDRAISTEQHYGLKLVGRLVVWPVSSDTSTAVSEQFLHWVFFFSEFHIHFRWVLIESP